jgi:hypothetical protein
MTIPEEAVEAAAQANFAAEFYVGWEGLNSSAKSSWRRKARAALEAAAPFLLESLASEAFKDKKIHGLQRVLTGNWIRGRITE